MPGNKAATMPHTVSESDRIFLADFEAARIAAADFHHREHVQLAYIYLCELPVEEARHRMKTALLRFLAHNNVDPKKYHATLTGAWLLAVRHFMAKDTPRDSADAFIDANPALLDTRIMQTHYSNEYLFSERARAGFVEPDRDPIPRH